MEKEAKIYCAGHQGLVGSAILRKLKADGYANFLLRTKAEVDLRRQQDVEDLFELEKPDYVFIAAALVGGVLANSIYRAEFIYNNLAICTNIIHASYLNKVKKLLMLGSNCIYPKFSAQPITENALLSGKLEPTNEPYAIAKIAAIKLCEAYRDQYGCNNISAMPANLMGENDHYDLERCHVLPALIRKFHEAKVSNEPTVTIWGTGKPRREFLYVDDCAEALIFLMNNYNEREIINVGSGEDLEIKQLAEMIAEIVGFTGTIVHDISKPDGMAKKLMDVSKINKLGWYAKTSLKEGIKKTYEDFKEKTV